MSNCPGCGRGFKSPTGLNSHQRTKFAKPECRLPEWRVVWDKATVQHNWRPIREVRRFSTSEEAKEFARSLEHAGSTVPFVTLTEDELSSKIYFMGLYSEAHQRFAAILHAETGG